MNAKMSLVKVNEIGTCPNIEVEIDVSDKSPFFIMPFHAREEDKDHTKQRNGKIMLFGYLERRIFSLFKPSYVGK